MRIVELKCPNCNGDITINTDRNFAFCPYCGTRLKVEEAQQIPDTIKVNREWEANNYVLRAQEYERVGDIDNAEIYYNRALDADVNNVRARDGYNRMQRLITEHNVSIQYIQSSSDPLVRLIVKEAGQTLCKIRRGEGMNLLLPIGEHPLLFYQGGSPKAYVRVTIRNRHDRAKIYTQTGMLWNKTSAEGTAEVMTKKAMYKIRN